MISEENIRQVISKTVQGVDVGKIESNKDLSKCGIDSLDMFDIVLELQELLGKEVPDDDVAQLRSISAIKAYFEVDNK